MKWFLIALLSIVVSSVSGFRIFPLRIYPVRSDEGREVTITESVRVKEATDPRKFSVGAVVRVVSIDNVVSTERIIPIVGSVSTEDDITTESAPITENIVATDSDALTDNVTATENVNATKNNYPAKNVPTGGAVTGNVIGPENVIAKSGVMTDNLLSIGNVVPTGSIVITSDVAAEKEIAIERVNVTEINAVAKDNIATTSAIEIDTATAKNNIATTKSAIDIDTVVATEVAISDTDGTSLKDEYAQKVVFTVSTDLKTNAPAKEIDTTEKISTVESIDTTDNGILKSGDLVEGAVTPVTDSSSTAGDDSEESVGSNQKVDTTESIVENVGSITQNIDFANSSTEKITEKIDSTESSIEPLPTRNSVGFRSESTASSETNSTKNIVSTENISSTDRTTTKVYVDFITEETLSTKSYESFGIFTYLVPPKTEFRKNEPDPRYDY